jgi:hypothetical protein
MICRRKGARVDRLFVGLTAVQFDKVDQQVALLCSLRMKDRFLRLQISD